MNKKPGFFVYALSVSLLIISAAIAYYFVIALPKIEHQKQNLEYEKFTLEKSAQDKEASKEKYYQTCVEVAETQARDTLKGKVEVASKEGGQLYDYMKNAYDEGMYLKDDYNSAYDKCLSAHGLK